MVLVATYFSKQVFKAENEKLCEPSTGSRNEHPSTSQFNKDTCQTSIVNLMLMGKICITFGTSAVRRLKRPTWFILSKYMLCVFGTVHSKKKLLVNKPYEVLSLHYGKLNSTLEPSLVSSINARFCALPLEVPQGHYE